MLLITRSSNQRLPVAENSLIARSFETSDLSSGQSRRLRMREAHCLVDMMSSLTDPELGFTGFTVERTTYRRQNGASVPSVQTLPASGCIHPGTPEMVQLLPEEERHEEFIAVYTDFSLSLGENDGEAEYSVPDRILWNGAAWRVVRVRDWSMFRYVEGMAVKMHE